MAKHQMLVCINYDDLSNIPHIEYLNYDSTDYPELIAGAGRNMKSVYDEVYVVGIDPYDSDFIREIIKRGKRV